MKRKTILEFDEINRLKLNGFDEYYAPMQIDIGSKERRRELAEFLTDAFLFFFSTFEVHAQYDRLLERQHYQQLLAEKVTEAVTKVTGIDSYMSDHIRTMSQEVVDTTFKKSLRSESESKSSTPESKTNEPIPDNTHTKSSISLPLLSSSYLPEESSTTPLQQKNVGGSSQDDDDEDGNGGYWLSYDRAEDIAKSEANTFLNYTDYVDAKELGYTKKRWLTMLDDKVRHTHSEVEGQTIGIDESFMVGDSLMRFPHDLSSSPNPKEVIGCRCAVEYLK